MNDAVADVAQIVANSTAPSPCQRDCDSTRQSFSGFSVTMVSIMLMGAGSSDDSARPTLPTTSLTSGTVRMARSCCLITSSAMVSEADGKIDGM